MEISKKEMQAVKVNSKIDTFYFELLIPAIPEKLISKSTPQELGLLLKNLVHLVGKRLVNERSILDNKLAYQNLSLTNKNTKIKRKAA